MIKEGIQMKKKKVIDVLLTIAIVFCFCIAGLLMYRNICYDEIVVSGNSMETTLHDGDLGYIKTTNSAKEGIKRFDIVVLKLEDNYEIIKRVIGLPGEKILIKENGAILINNVEIEQNFIDQERIEKTYISNTYACKDELLIPNDSYYVLGDNRGNSTDSRIRGVFKANSVDGVLKVIYKHCDSENVCKLVSPKWF